MSIIMATSSSRRHCGTQQRARRRTHVHHGSRCGTAGRVVRPARRRAAGTARGRRIRPRTGHARAGRRVRGGDRHPRQCDAGLVRSAGTAGSAGRTHRRVHVRRPQLGRTRCRSRPHLRTNGASSTPVAASPWSRAAHRPRRFERIEELAGADVRRVAIANPDHAPYGRAAREALQSAGIWDALGDRLVIAENVRQTLQFTAPATWTPRWRRCRSWG
jgi:hypothetical protein